MEELTPSDQEKCNRAPLHLQESAKFYLSCVQKLKWGDLSESPILDIGCGIEFRNLFTMLFPKYHSIVGIDNDKFFIDYLKGYRLFGRDRVTYHVADITDRTTLTEWKSNFRRIISFYCLNTVRKERVAYENIHYMLQPGGEAIIICELGNPLFTIHEKMTEKPQWRDLKDYLNYFPEHPTDANGNTWHEKVLNEIGFEVLLCRVIERKILFKTKEQFEGSIFTREDFMHRFLKPDEAKEYKKEFHDTMREYNGRCKETDAYILRTTSVHIVIRKKDA